MIHGQLKWGNRRMPLSPLSHHLSRSPPSKSFPNPDVFHLQPSSTAPVPRPQSASIHSNRAEDTAAAPSSLLLFQHDLVAADCRAGSGSHARRLTTPSKRLSTSEQKSAHNELISSRRGLRSSDKSENRRANTCALRRRHHDAPCKRSARAWSHRSHKVVQILRLVPRRRPHSQHRLLDCAIPNVSDPSA